MLEVTTVGTGAKWLIQWDLDLHSTPPDQDSAWQDLSRRQGHEAYFPLEGRKTPLRWGYLHANGVLAPPPDGWKPRPAAVRVRYEPTAGVLGLDGTPFDVLDAGTSYWVYAVDSTGSFTGRWLGGGLLIGLFPTPLGTLGEQSEGYFCAHRTRAP